jgi:hypothetical protein
MRENPLMKKSWAIGTILLFIGTSIIPLASSLPIEKEQVLTLKNCFDGFTINGTKGDNGWYVSPVWITLDFPGNYTVYYSIDGGEWQEYTGPFVVSTDGQHTVQAYFIDDEGNVSLVYSISFMIDSHAPWIDGVTSKRIGLFKWEINVNVVDPASGCCLVEFYFDGSLIGSATAFPWGITWSYNFRTWLKILIVINLMGQYWRGLYVIAYDCAGNYVVYPTWHGVNQ